MQTQLQNSLTSFDQQQKRTSCTSLAKRTGEQCPNILNILSNEDKSDSSLGLLKSQYPICQKLLNPTGKQPGLNTARDLALHMEKYQGSSLGLLVHSQIRKCITENGNQDKEKEIISKYYYNFSRIERAQLLTLDEAAVADQILGYPILKDYDCHNLTFDSAKKKCLEIKSNCIPDQDILKKTEDKIQKAKQLIQELQSQKRHLQNQYRSITRRTGRSEQGQKIQAQIAALDMGIAMIYSHNPLLNGKDYLKILASRKSESEALKAQIKANKVALKNYYRQGDVIQMCLSGSRVPGCSSENVRDYIDKAPDLPGQLNLKMGDTKANAIEAYSYTEFQKCLHNGTMDRLKTADTINGAFMDMTLTAATLGLGALYTAPKALISARKLAMAKYAKAADHTINAGYLGKGISKAFQECSRQEVPKVAPGSGNNNCQLKNPYEGSPILEEYDSCIASALWAGLDGLPFTSGFLQKWARSQKNSASSTANWTHASQANLTIQHAKSQGRSKEAILKNVSKIDDRVDGGASRLALAEEVLGRKLMADEKKWILEAHKLHSDKSYKLGNTPSAELTNADLKDKIRVGGGRPTTMSKEDTRKLMENGILGHYVDPGAKIRFVDGNFSNLPPALTQDQRIINIHSRIKQAEQRAIRQGTAKEAELNEFLDQSKHLYEEVRAKAQGVYNYESSIVISSHDSSLIRIFGRDLDYGEDLVKTLKKTSGSNVSASLDKEMDALKSQAEKHFESAKSTGNVFDYYRGQQLMNARKQIGYAAEEHNITTKIDGFEADEQFEAIRENLMKDKNLKNKIQDLEKGIRGT